MSALTVVPLPTSHRFRSGDDLAGAIVAAADAAGWHLATGDVVCVASKVVSKVEDARVTLRPDLDVQGRLDVRDDVGVKADLDVHAARREAARRLARRVVADGPGVLVVETEHGFVCANAGIDASNVGEVGRGDATGTSHGAADAAAWALRLPDDPDASAQALRDRLQELTGERLGVLVTDTFGRPWRLGQTDVALGVAGVAPLRDERGGTDLDGRPLDVTLIAVADALAGAADIVRRKSGGVPFVLVRGAEVDGGGSGQDLLRPPDEDLFRWGGATAVEEALAAAVDRAAVDEEAVTAPTPGEGPAEAAVDEEAVTAPAPGEGPGEAAVDEEAVDEEAVRRVLAAAAPVAQASPHVTCRPLPGGPPIEIAVDVHAATRTAMLEAGAVVLALRAAAAALGLAATSTPGEGLRATTIALRPSPSR